MNSHANTEKKLELNLNIWREAHYLPDGKFELRFNDTDRVDKAEYEESFRNRFSTFISFLNWAFKQESYLGGSLDLRGLTNTEGLVLPKEIGGSLDLRGLTNTEGLVLPEKIGGSLYLRGLTRAEGLVLPKEIYLRGLTRAEGLVLPKEIGGWLDLSGLTSAKRKELKEKYPRINIF